MRSFATTLIFSIALGMVAFGSVYLWNKHKIDEHHAHLSAFDWFCEEFGVSSEQRGKIEELHLAYFPECEDHCVHYADTKRTLAKITEDPNLDGHADHVEAARKLAELEKDADKKFIDFVYGVAAEMEPSASQEYLRRMKGWLDKSGEIAVK